MADSLQLTESDIRSLASGQSFDRGYRYYRNGYVHGVAWRGNLITANVEGSEYEPYQVQVRLAGHRVDTADCNCPYDWGGYCKHIVATLLYYLHNRDEIEEKPELETMLAGLTEAQLRQLILNVAEGEPGLIDAFEREIEWLQPAPATTVVTDDTGTSIHVDVNAIRRKIYREFRQAGSHDEDYYDYYGDYGPEVNADLFLEPHLEKVQALLDAGDVATATSVLTAVVEAWIDGLSDLDEWIYEYNQDVIGDAQLDLGAALAEVLLSREMTAAEREQWLERIAEWEEELSDLAIAETAVQQGWDYPPLVAAMQGHITDKGAWADEAPYFADKLALARLRILERQQKFQEYIHLAAAESQIGLYVNMLARTGQTEKAAAEAKQYLPYPQDVLSLARVLVAKGETDAALDLAAHGLQLEQNMGKPDLARWTREQAEQAGKPELALAAAQTAFTSSHELADYREAQRLAGEQWPDVRPRLLKSLEGAFYVSQKIDVYLHENMLAEAMRALENEEFYLDSDLRRVIEATREAHPEWGIRQCQRRAEQIMDGARSDAYDTAVARLSLARDIYQQHARLSEWRQYLDGLLETHHRKYKLVPMLREIR